MAAIDFPASPTNNQVFVAPNGVTYVYSSTYTAWQAQPLSAGYVGDFCANQTSGFPALTTTYTTLLVTPVITGNAGGWYNTSNGRYTPPAGRYHIQGGFSWVGISSPQNCGVQILKNGVVIGTGTSSSPAAGGYYANPEVSLVLDANGTDYFELRGYSGASGGGTMNGLYFQAFPIVPNVSMTQGTGDFCAVYNGADYGLSGTSQVLLPPTIISGNAGGWYNASNGRYTPPAGRYVISGACSDVNTAGTTGGALAVRKNGTALASSFQSATSGGYTVGPSLSITVDANGSDYFDLFLSGYSAGTTGRQISFTAFPISGIKGPQGDAPAGALMLYSEHVLSAPGNVLAVTIPPLAKLVQLEWGTSNGGSVNDALWLQMMQGGTALNTANYEWQESYGSASAGGGVQANGQVGWNVNHGHSSNGWFKTSYLASAITGYAGGFMMGNGQYWEIQTGGGRVTRNFSAMYNALITGGLASITGFRLTPQTTNLVAGSYLRCWAAT